MLNIEEYINYKHAEQFLDSLIVDQPLPHFVAAKQGETRRHAFGVERIERFLHAIGSPHLNNRYVHITGTSGKSSTAYLAANLLQAQGYRTGLFTSPPIRAIAETLMINGELPSAQAFVALVNQIKPAIDREYARGNFGLISQFECLVAMAFRYFAQQRTDVVVLEVGLGGRHDATNVIESADVSVITNIGLDHTHVLGKTHREIAAEKIGILKPGCPLITAEKRPEILALFAEEAQKIGSEMQVLGRDFRLEKIQTGNAMTVFDYMSESRSYQALEITLRGAYQAENAALAIRALEIISAKRGTAIDETALRTGLLVTDVPGRCEQAQTEPTVILDGAHNPDKIAGFAAYLKRRYERDEVIFVCGFTSGKPPEAMLQSLLDISRTFYLTRVIVGSRESEDPIYLQSVLTTLDQSVAAIISADPFTALDLAIEHAKREEKIVCVTGSLYLVSYLRQRWYPEHTLLN